VNDVAYLELDSFEPITSHQDTFLWTYMSPTQDNSLLARPNRPQPGLMRPSCTLPVLTPDHVMSTFWRIDNNREALYAWMATIKLVHFIQ